MYIGKFENKIIEIAQFGLISKMWYLSQCIRHWKQTKLRHLFWGTSLFVRSLIVKMENTHDEINIIWVARRKNPEDTIQSQCHFLVHSPQKSHLHFLNFGTFQNEWPWQIHFCLIPTSIYVMGLKTWWFLQNLFQVQTLLSWASFIETYLLHNFTLEIWCDWNDHVPIEKSPSNGVSCTLYNSVNPLISEPSWLYFPKSSFIEMFQVLRRSNPFP